MKWGINITLQHLGYFKRGNISHGVSPRIPISASLTNGKHFSTPPKSDSSKLDFVKFEFTQNMESVSKLAKQYDAQYMIPNKQYISSNI